MTEAVIVATARSPIGRANKGSLVDLRPDDMTAQILRALMAKVPQVKASDVEDLMLGIGQPAGEGGFNIARVAAMLAGLESAIALGVTELEVVSDSELMVKQMRGEYKVKNEALKELQGAAATLARRLGRVTYTAVRRESNKLADQLVNDALDAAR